MVALPCSTVATSSASMVAWAGWTLLLLTCIVHAHASSGGRFNGDVNDDDAVIDKLKEVWASRRHALHQLGPSPVRPRHQNVNEKIDFAVTPQDARYYRPPAPSRHEPPPPSTDLFPFLSPEINLNLQPRLDYPGDPLQYQEEDVQYPTEYAAQYSPQFLPQERHRPSYLSQQDLQYPRGLYPADLKTLQYPRQLEGEDEEDEGVEQDVEEAREMLRKELVDDAEYNADSQLMMKKGEAERARQAEESKGEDVTDGTETAAYASLKRATSQPETMNYMHLRRAPASNHESSFTLHHAPETPQEAKLSDVYFTAAVAGCTAVAVCAVVGAGICWYRLNKSHRAAEDAEYPAYGVTGPNKDLSPSGDRKLAQSAHMYHYQHQKQQMIALEKSSGGERHGSTSDADSDEEDEENPVYECPGLAPIGEMEVKNPLFHDHPTPATPSIRKGAEQDHDRHEEDQSNK